MKKINWTELESGMIIMVNDKKYLVGDINEMGGTCDCCSELEGQIYLIKKINIDYEDKQ